MDLSTPLLHCHIIDFLDTPSNYIVEHENFHYPHLRVSNFPSSQITLQTRRPLPAYRRGVWEILPFVYTISEQMYHSLSLDL